MTIQAVELLKELFFPNRERHSIPPLDGALQPNEVLEHCPVISSSVEAPDDLVVGEDGALFVSSGRRILRLAGEDFSQITVVAEFDGLAGGLNINPQGHLMVCIAGKGVALVAQNGRKTWIKEANGKTIKCPNSAIADAKGNIYIADGSLHHESSDWVHDLMEKRSAGRILRYDPKEDTCEVLLDGLGYPYGLCLTPDDQWLIISESWKHTLSRYPLNDVRPATENRLIPNMPGYPGRIVPAADGGYWMCLFAMRTELVELVLTETGFRLEMMETMEPTHWVAPALSSSGDPYEYLQFGAVRSLGYLKPWAPPRSYGLVVKLDKDLNVTSSFHSRAAGTRHGITGIWEHQYQLFIASKGHGVIMKMEDQE